MRLVHEFSIASVPGRLDGYVAAAVIHACASGSRDFDSMVVAPVGLWLLLLLEQK